MAAQASAWAVLSECSRTYCGPLHRSMSARLSTLTSVGQRGRHRQQIQGIGLARRLELRADQVQMAAGGLNVMVPQQAADGVQMHAGYQQLRGEAVPPV